MNHHYLPVFYLQRWAGADGRVIRYYRPEGRPDGKVVASPIGPRFTGYESRLYELPGTEYPQILETDFLSPVDDGAARVLGKMLNGGLRSLSDDERQKWALFVMSLPLRIPQALKELGVTASGVARAYYESANQAEYAASRRSDDPLSVFDYAIQQVPSARYSYKAALPMMINSKEIGARIIKMCWKIIDVSEAGHSLLTGDRPLMTSSGLGDPECLMSLPVSPTQVFVAAYDDRRISAALNQDSCDTARNLNSCTARMAVENVYGCSNKHLQFVEDRLRKSDAPIDLGLFSRKSPSRTPPPAG